MPHDGPAVFAGARYRNRRGQGGPVRWICEALEALGAEIGALNSIGGECSSPVWTRSLSDVM